MICESCHKVNATVFITQIVNGKKVEMHLCSSCARELEGTINNDDSFHQLLSGLFKMGESGTEVVKEQGVICPKCKMTLEDFKRMSKFGCDKCYEVYKPYVIQIVKSVHGGIKHTGKRPKRLNEKVALQENINSLEAQLKIALMQEDYLEAARIRDELRVLKEGQQ